MQETTNNPVNSEIVTEEINFQKQHKSNSDSTEQYQINFPKKYSTRQRKHQKVKDFIQHEQYIDAQLQKAELKQAQKYEEKQQQLLLSEQNQQQVGYFTLQLDQILWRRQKQDIPEYEYLVKFKNYSYLHCDWVSEQDILAESKGTRNKFNRFIKNFENKIRDENIECCEEEQIYFDPSYIEVDRILSCNELFPVIHPKKSNEIKGKWSENMVIFIQKLLNFTKDKVHYGIHFMEPVNPERDNCPDYLEVIQNPMDLGTIINRVYLDVYENFQQILQDLGLVFKNCILYNQNPSSDIRILSDTLRECAVVLYKEWHAIETKKYNLLKEYLDKELKDSQIEDMLVRQDQEENQKIELEEPSQEQLFQKQMSQENEVDYFIQQQIISVKTRRKKGVIIPLTYQELEKYNPGKFTFEWLQDEPDQNVEEFIYLTEVEIQSLSFVKEVDRLYLVKWKNLSYLEITWEHESSLQNPQKINEFRTINRALDRESRQTYICQLNIHQTLLELEEDSQGVKKRKKLTPQHITEMKNKLYSYNIKSQKQLHQYTQKNQPIYKQRKLLRSYQLDSLNWLIEAWYNKRNVILADEMGLGKTIQSISFINHLYTFENVRGPFLVIAPLSTLEHWKRTVDDWTNLNAVLYYDEEGQEGRNLCKFYESFYIDISTQGMLVQQKEIYKFQVLITSSEVFLSDINQFIINIPFQFIIVDEAHRLKNYNAKILQNLKKLPCKRTLLLTGTPIQNNTEELWTLLNYIEPSKFSSLNQFRMNFGELQTEEQVNTLQQTIKPYLLRRMKEDVENSIPPLQETIIDIEMTTIQKTIYRAIYEKNKGMLQKQFSSIVLNTSLNNLEMQLRKCCSHPFLIKEIEQDVIQSCENEAQKFEKVIQTSGKMILLDKLIQKFKTENKKILIFSQFIHILTLIEFYLKFKQIKYEKIDGSVKSKERQSAIDRFNDLSKGRDVFLLSTKAGGLGINLTSANIVIIFDSDWNPQNDVQATARAHRIGQTQEVLVYRFVTKKTYEAEMFERASKKLGLDQAIFMGGEFKRSTNEQNNNNNKKMGKEEIETLLKKGILGLLNEEEEIKKSNDFFLDDIDEILQKNTRIAQYSIINGNYTFAKGSFIANKGDSDLNIDDPNFWNKVLKDQESRSLLCLKEFDAKAKKFNRNPELQKSYFFKVCEFVNEIISSKLSQHEYNADDENNVKEILTKIQHNRDFNVRYKDLAMNLFDEVTRPSRRFKKITQQDLDGNGPIFNQTNIHIKQLTEKDNNDLYYEPNTESDSDEEVQLEKLTQNKKGKQTYQGALSSRLQNKSNVQFSQEGRYQEYLKKICSVCEKPKCSLYCSSICKRNFHDSCKEFAFEQKPKYYINQLNPIELTLSDEELQKMINAQYVCQDCKDNRVVCFLCKHYGNYNHNISTTNTRINREVVTKCSTANCNKFYHIDCIKNHPLFKFLDSNNRKFRCSLHYCASCNVSGDSMAISQCTKCPKAYHPKCFNSLKIKKISKKLMICENHFNENQKRNSTSQYSTSKMLLQQQQAEKKVRRENENSKIGLQKQNSIQFSNKKFVKMQEKESTRIEKQQNEKILLQYEDFGIPCQRDFDYSKYKKDWCRYCGARFSSNFTKGPWGPRTLCTIHYIAWNQKKKLDLKKFKELPLSPIDPDDLTELSFMNRLKQKEKNYDFRATLEKLMKDNLFYAHLSFRENAENIPIHNLHNS